MPSLSSIEDLFYGPPEPTWILRDIMPPPRIHEPLRPVERYVKPHRGIINRSIRPVERVARRVHTVQSDPAVPVRVPHEEIREVVEVPVHVPDHVPVATAPPVVVKRSVSPPIQRTIIHHPIELMVPMCCEKCAKKVKDRLLDLDGVESVVTDQYHQKVTVYGSALDPARVLHRVKLVKKRSTSRWTAAKTTAATKPKTPPLPLPNPNPKRSWWHRCGRTSWCSCRRSVVHGSPPSCRRSACPSLRIREFTV